MTSKSCLLGRTSFALGSSGARLFSHLIRDSCPPLRCQGSAQALPLLEWYQCSLAVRDRHRLARFSPPLCVCVLTCQSSEPFEVNVLMQNWRRGHWRSRTKNCCWVAEIAQKQNSGWCCCCHSDREIKPPVSKDLNWVPALNTRRWTDNHREWDWKKKRWRQNYVCLKLVWKLWVSLRRPFFGPRCLKSLVEPSAVLMKSSLKDA